MVIVCYYFFFRKKIVDEGIYFDIVCFDKIYRLNCFYIYDCCVNFIIFFVIMIVEFGKVRCVMFLLSLFSFLVLVIVFSVIGNSLFFVFVFFM